MSEHQHEWAPLGVGRRCGACGLEEFVFQPWQMRLMELSRKRLVLATPRRPDGRLRRLAEGIRRVFDGRFDGTSPE